MRSTTVITSLAFVFAGTAFAQSSGNSSMMMIEVGKGGLVFNPASMTAAPGTKVEFEFYPGNHSVMQADFNTPCQPSARAFFSGFINSQSGPAKTTFVLTINDTNPIWFYCPQITHCQSGMVGVINPPSGTAQTLAMFSSAASKANQMAPPAGGPVGGSTSGNETAGASSSSSAAASATASSSAKATASASSGAGGGAYGGGSSSSAAWMGKGLWMAGIVGGLGVGLLSVLV